MGAHRPLIVEVLEKTRVQMDGCTLRNLAAEELGRLGDQAFAEIEYLLWSEGGKGVPSTYHDLERRFPGIGALWTTYFTMGATRIDEVVVFLPTLNDAVLASAIPYIGVAWSGKPPLGEIPEKILQLLARELSKSKHPGVAGAAKWLVKQRAPYLLAAAKPAPAKAEDPKETARKAIEEMVHRETKAWDAKDAAALVELFHPDMVWPWPPTDQDHDPAKWVAGMGRFDRERWQRGWQQLFANHQLIHNRRQLQKVVLTEEADGGFAVVDIDTLWRGAGGRENHWHGRVCKVYTRMRDGGWKLIAHTGALAYPPAPAAHALAGQPGADEAQLVDGGARPPGGS